MLAIWIILGIIAVWAVWTAYTLRTDEDNITGCNQRCNQGRTCECCKLCEVKRNFESECE